MHKATTIETDALRTYLYDSVARGMSGIDAIRPRDDVTLLMYFFWPIDNALEQWSLFKGAILETWRHCGRLKTVVVSNMRHACCEAFASQFVNVELQIEPSLCPGNINTMSVDCNSRLHERFNTNYVLIVQDDGFPLRPGLDEFVDMGFDFIGSPYCRALPMPNLLTRILNYCPSNGGFSLRSKKICQLAARLWMKYYADKEFSVEEMSEDLFYTVTLPQREPLFWLKRKQAPSIVAERFSYEGVFPLYSKKLPFGFHTATGFSRLVEAFGIGLGNMRKPKL